MCKHHPTYLHLGKHPPCLAQILLSLLGAQVRGEVEILIRVRASREVGFAFGSLGQLDKRRNAIHRGRPHVLPSVTPERAATPPSLRRRSVNRARWQADAPRDLAVTSARRRVRVAYVPTTAIATDRRPARRTVLRQRYTHARPENTGMRGANAARVNSHRTRPSKRARCLQLGPTERVPDSGLQSHAPAPRSVGCPATRAGLLDAGARQQGTSGGWGG